MKPIEKRLLSKAERSKWPVLAICYDFDKTLSPRNMQEFGLIQRLGYADNDKGIKRFWDDVNSFSSKNNVDIYHAGMLHVIRKMFEKRVPICAETFADFGGKVKLYDGVETWFERMRKYGEKHHVVVEHYIISAGYKEMIEGVRVGKRLMSDVVDRIYASSFYFAKDGVQFWPARVVDYTGKTQILYRIKKNKMEESDASVNEPVERDRVPFRNMVYIGDSETDIPCMKIVKDRGGVSIGVYSPKTANKDRILEIMKAERISFYTPADYRAGSKMDALLKAIINKTEATAALELEKDKMDAEFARAIAIKAEREKEKVRASKSSAIDKVLKETVRQYKGYIDNSLTFASPSLTCDYAVAEDYSWRGPFGHEGIGALRREDRTSRGVVDLHGLKIGDGDYVSFWS